MIRLNLGCCDLPIEGYINIDSSTSPHIKADLIADALDLSAHFKENGVDEIWAAHLLEHLYPEEADKAIKHWKSLLKGGGTLAIVVPDFDVLCQQYLEGAISLEEMNNLYIYSYQQESHHRFMYNQESLINLLARHGFRDLKIIDQHKDPRLAYGVDWQCGAEGKC